MIRRGWVRLLKPFLVRITRFRLSKGVIAFLSPLSSRGSSILNAANHNSMLYADDAGVVSQSLEQLRKMMGVIVVVCAAFGLTVSEAKTEMMCLHAKGMPESTAT